MVESECDAGGFRSTISVAAPFVWRCLARSPVAPVSTPTGSPEAVARPRFPQNVACGFPAPTLFGSCFTALRCYLFKFRFHGQLIFSLNRRPCLPLNGAHVAQEQFNYR